MPSPAVDPGSSNRLWLAAAALSGLVAVAAGAFAAHGLEAGDPRAAELVRTASTYQMWHALATLAGVALGFPARPLSTAFLGGAVLFSGSLYALALGAPRWLGIVTPFGGLLFLAGWALMAVYALRGREAR